MELRTNPTELLVRGVVIDRVQHVVGSLSSFANPGDPDCSILRPNHMAAWYKNIEDIVTRRFGPYQFRMPQGVVGRTYVLGGTAWEALFRTLILDTDDLIFDAARDFPILGRTGPTEEYPFWEEGTGFRRRMLGSFEQPDLSLDNQSVIMVSYEMSEYYSRVSRNCEYRSLYVTERGFVGLCPQETKIGDIIGLPSGASVPYVLRPRKSDLAMLWDAGKKIKTEREAFFQMPDNGERKVMIMRVKKPRFQLVGECYTQGIMCGEAWTADGFFVEEFVLY
jgi:hypothetical protein